MPQQTPEDKSVPSQPTASGNNNADVATVALWAPLRERWGKQTTPEPGGGLDGWKWGEDLTADHSRRLQGGCLVPAFLLLCFSPSLFIPAFLHLRLPGRFSPSTRLHADRNIANSESSLIASSAAQHLVLPSPLKEQLQFFISNLNGWNVVVNLSFFSLPSIVYRIDLDLVTALLASHSVYRFYFRRISYKSATQSKDKDLARQPLKLKLEQFKLNCCSQSDFIFLFTAKRARQLLRFRIKQLKNTHSYPTTYRVWVKSLQQDNEHVTIWYSRLAFPLTLIKV